jgi:hypothetical protein
MGKVYSSIQDSHRKFIEAQKMFFVSTAPLDKDGHINLSPKGMDTFRILSPTRVAYLDFVGSGNETSAHTLENGRITIMFCAFHGPPDILRLYGKGHAILPTDKEWPEIAAHFTPHPGTRQVIVADIRRVNTSCGYSVPLYTYAGERDHLDKWVERKGTEGLKQYQAEKNRKSIDGLPTDLAERGIE